MDSAAHANCQALFACCVPAAPACICFAHTQVKRALWDGGIQHKVNESGRPATSRTTSLRDWSDLVRISYTNTAAQVLCRCGEVFW